MADLILASTSPARRALLATLGIEFRAVSPEVEEVVAPGQSVREAVTSLAQCKAQAVSARFPGAWVLGADQLASVDGQIFGKPIDRDAARAQLQKLSGRTHILVTGLFLTNGLTHGPTNDLRTWSAFEEAQLTLYPLSPALLERYLDTEEWRGCAGSYRVESKGQWLMSAIEGDRSNVQGLPLLSVVRLLREALGEGALLR